MYKIREEEKRELDEALDILKKQLLVEGQLIALYAEAEKEIQSKAVNYVLHMIHLESMKHIDILQLATNVLNGDNVLGDEKEEILRGLVQHIELEKEAFSSAKKLLDNTWIRENKGLKELVTKWRDDEKEHIEALKKLTEKTFFRISDFDQAAIFKSTDELDERYSKYEKNRH